MTAAEQFDRDERNAAESLALEFAIADAGGWDAYVALRDGRDTPAGRAPQTAGRS
jgi:hypothetical protein